MRITGFRAFIALWKTIDTAFQRKSLQQVDIHLQHIPVSKKDFPTCDQRRGMQDTQDSVSDGGFSAARFTCQADHLARLNRE